MTGGRLTYVPRHKGKATFKFKFLNNTRVETTARAVSRQYTDFKNSDAESIDSYCCVDFKIIQPVLLKTNSAEIFAHVKSLFDTGFEFHHGYPDDGFKFVCGLNVSF